MFSTATITSLALLAIVGVVAIVYINYPTPGNTKQKTFLQEKQCNSCPDSGNDNQKYTSSKEDMFNVEPVPDFQQARRNPPGPGAPHLFGISSSLMNGMSNFNFHPSSTAQEESQFSCYSETNNSNNPTVVTMNGVPYSTINGEPLMFKDAAPLYTDFEKKKETANNSGMSIRAMNMVNSARNNILEEKERDSTSYNNIMTGNMDNNSGRCYPETDDLSLINALVAPSSTDRKRESNILNKGRDLAGGPKICGRVEGGKSMAATRMQDGKEYSTISDDANAIIYLLNQPDKDLKARYIDIFASSGRMGLDEDAVFYKRRNKGDFLLGDLNLPIPQGENPDDYLNKGIYNC